MALAVVLDRMAAAHDFAAEVRIAQCLVADAKEAGPGAVAIENVEHLRRHERIRSVVDRQCDLAPRRRGRGQARASWDPSSELRGMSPATPSSR